MISDWFRNIHSGSRRTTAIAKSSDPSLATFFAEDAAESSRQSSKLQDRIEPLLQTQEEKDIWVEIKKARAGYLAGRDVVTKAKAEGRAEDAERLFTQQYQPATQRYIDMVQRLLDMQRAAIDSSAADVLVRFGQPSRHHHGGLAGLCAGRAGRLVDHARHHQAAGRGPARGAHRGQQRPDQPHHR